MSPSTLNDQGFPLDYHDGSLKFLGQLRLDFYKNAVDRVMTRDPYAAMLMAMHGVALMNAGYGKYAYPPDRTSDPRVKAYVDHQDALRLKILASCVNRRSTSNIALTSGSGPTTNTWKCSTCWRNLSAIVIRSIARRGSLDRRTRSTTSKHGQKTVRMTIDPVGEHKAIHRPFPFALDPLPLSFTARLVPNRSYKDGEDFLGEFYRAERITVNHMLASS